MPNSSDRIWGVADDGTAIEVTITGPRPDGVDRIGSRWPPVGLTRTGTRPTNVIRQLVVDADAPGNWDRLESDLALFAAERLGTAIAVHAAVIAIDDDRALLVPGRSGAGKSTLCVAAHELGHDVLSDEFALVDARTGLVSGWRRPVRVRCANGGVERRDLAVDAPPLAGGVIAHVSYDPSSRARWTHVGRAEAVLGILDNTVCAQTRPDAALDAALAITRTAVTVAGARGEARDALPALIRCAARVEPA